MSGGWRSNTCKRVLPLLGSLWWIACEQNPEQNQSFNQEQGQSSTDDCSVQVPLAAASPSWLDALWAISDACPLPVYDALAARESTVEAESRPKLLRRMGILEGDKLEPPQWEKAWAHLEAAAALFESNPDKCELLSTRRFQLEQQVEQHNRARAEQVSQAGFQILGACTNPQRLAEFWVAEAERQKKEGDPLEQHKALLTAQRILEAASGNVDVDVDLLRVKRRLISLQHDLGDIEAQELAYRKLWQEAESLRESLPKTLENQQKRASLLRESFNLHLGHAYLRLDQAIAQEANEPLTSVDPDDSVRLHEELLEKFEQEPTVADRMPALKLGLAWALAIRAELDRRQGDGTDIASSLARAHELLEGLPYETLKADDVTLAQFRQLIAVRLLLTEAQPLSPVAESSSSQPNEIKTLLPDPGALLKQAEQLLTAVTPELTEQEALWRVRSLWAELFQLTGRAQAAREVLWQAVVTLDDERRASVREYPLLAWQSQRVGLYLQWVMALVEGLGDTARNPGSPSTPPAIGLRLSEDARKAHQTSRTQFVEGPISPDALLAAVEYLSAQDFVEAAQGDAGGLLQLLQAGKSQGLLEGKSRLNLEQTGAQLRALLPSGVPVLVYFPLPNEILLLKVTRERVVPYHLPLNQRSLQEAVRGVVNSLATAADAQDTTAQASLTEKLDALGDKLLAPVWAGLPTDQPVGALLQGALISLPFQALRREGRYLVQKVYPFEIPAFSLLQPGSVPSKGKGKGREPLKALAVGYGEKLESISPELAVLQKPGLRVTTLEGKQATLAAFQSMLRSVSLLHMDVHASGPEQVVANAEVVQKNTAHLKLVDGELEAEALSQLNLSHLRLAVLAACETAQGTGGALNGSRGAISRSMQLAGAEATVASRWSAGDAPTLRLMTALYQNYPEKPRAQALAEAQRSLINSQELVAVGSTRLMHPVDPPQMLLERVPGASPGGTRVPLSTPWSWAAFSLSGRWD